jgi:hypothetical protein
MQDLSYQGCGWYAITNLKLQQREFGKVATLDKRGTSR